MTEQEVAGEATNDVQSTAEHISRFGTSRGNKPAAEITGTAPESAGASLPITIVELDGSLGTATEVALAVGDSASGSGEIGDEAAPDGPPDFDFFKIPELVARAGEAAQSEPCEPQVPLHVTE